METRLLKQKPFRGKAIRPRSGQITIIMTIVITTLLGFAALAVDLSYIALTKSQMQNASDAAALASASDLLEGWGTGASADASSIANLGMLTAETMAAEHPAGEQSEVFVDGIRDVRFGQRVFDVTTQTWQENWGVSPYNLVEVSVHRNQSSSSTSTSDVEVPLFFGNFMGRSTQSLSTTSKAALVAGVGFRIQSGSGLTADVLPIALDEASWNTLVQSNVGDDDYSFDPISGTVTSGADGIKEVSLYPTGSGNLPPGNRGTVDLGSPNNSTADLKRQILHGLNDYDLSFFNGSLRFDQGPLYINGDTGISAGIKSELNSIKGHPRAIPLFTAVSGPGNNATYTIEQFVGVRIMYVKLTGGNKRVIVQPAPFMDPTVIAGPTTEVVEDSIFTMPKLIQ